MLSIITAYGSSGHINFIEGWMCAHRGSHDLGFGILDFGFMGQGVGVAQTLNPKAQAPAQFSLSYCN
jgi:hypothetical protein